VETDSPELQAMADKFVFHYDPQEHHYLVSARADRTKVLATIHQNDVELDGWDVVLTRELSGRFCISCGGPLAPGERRLHTACMERVIEGLGDTMRGSV